MPQRTSKVLPSQALEVAGERAGDFRFAGQGGWVARCLPPVTSRDAGCEQRVFLKCCRLPSPSLMFQICPPPEEVFTVAIGEARRSRRKTLCARVLGSYSLSLCLSHKEASCRRHGDSFSVASPIVASAGP